MSETLVLLVDVSKASAREVNALVRTFTEVSAEHRHVARPSYWIEREDLHEVVGAIHVGMGR